MVLRHFISLITLFSLSVSLITAQSTLLQENFEDHNLSQNPVWTGNTEHFIFYEREGSTLLRLNAPESGATQLRTPLHAAYGTWELFFEQNFSPSNNNRAFIYLVSDREDLSGGVNGYAIRTGENSSPNHFRLLRITDGNSTEILAGELDISGGGAYRLRITRSSEGMWSLFESEGYNSSPLFAGSVEDNLHAVSSWFGFKLNYTSTRRDGFFFDDIVVRDGIEPFSVNRVEAVASRRIEVIFSEPFDPETGLNPANYSITGVPAIEGINLLTQNSLEIILANPIDAGTHILTISNVEDLIGNVMDSLQIEFEVVNPFQAAEAVSVSNRVIEIGFTDEIESTSASDYLLNGEVSPATATITAPDRVSLEFAEPVPSGLVHILISSVASISGWVIPNQTEVEMYMYDDYAEGDVVINEFMYRSPDHFRTPENDRPQYVELFNRTPKYLNLKEWVLKRSIDTEYRISDADLLLKPDSYLVLTNDSPLFEEIYGERNFIEMTAFPRFLIGAASSDQVRIYTNEGVLADSLQYSVSEWGGVDVALERRSMDAPSYYPENWGESPNEMLGTPGLTNEVQPDSDPPELLSIEFLSGQGFQLVFSKRMDAETATHRENYRINPALPISLVMVQNNRVTLIIDGDLVDEQIYEILVENVTDIFGNLIEPVSRAIHYFEISDAKPNDLVINEILYRRAQSGEPEFVEIYNRTTSNIDMSGWTLSDASGSAQLPPGTVIRGGNYLVFTDSNSFAVQDERVLYLSNWPGLNNNGDAVVIRNENGIAIDSLFYEQEWGNHVAGVSLERRDPGALSIDPANWLPSMAESGATPLAENSRFEIDVKPPEIVFANLFHPDSIEVVFSEFIKPLKNSDMETRFFVDGVEVQMKPLATLQGNRIVLPARGVEMRVEATLTAENVSDFQGNIADAMRRPVAQPVGPGALVFNEIMFHPLADDHDGIPNQSEYIELYNRSSHAVSMEGLFLHDEPDENGGITRMDPVSTKHRWVEAGGYVLIYPETAPVLLSDSRTGIFFETDPVIDSTALRMNRSTLSLTNSGRQVYLADSTGGTIDAVEYRPDWHNPNLISTVGIALERISPDLETNNPSNWGSSTAVAGGTPGKMNTLYQEPGRVAEGAGIKLEPNPFSPDDDGFEDNLFINYTLDEPDYLLRVRVFDRYGRRVRTLADGLNAGLSGSIIWDGRTDTGQRNRIGIYIVYVEAYNSSNGKRRTFRETAVLARQF